MPVGSKRGKMVICGRKDECEGLCGDAEICFTVTCTLHVTVTSGY